MISEYLKISLFEVDELDLVQYLFFQKESFIYKMLQTEDGIEYLENAWRLEQTEPDRETLRREYGNQKSND